MVIINTSHSFQTKTGEIEVRIMHEWQKSTHILTLFTLKPGHDGWTTWP